MARIIYAEDDQLVGELVQAVLMDAGHAVGVVPDGKAAMAVLANRRPDLLILDMSMPEMSGSEVLDKVRRDPALYDMPVLIITGRVSVADETIARTAGATEYLRKPFDPDELTVIVDRLLRRRPPPSQSGAARRI